MKTDLDRLHAVATGELQGRGIGKTWLSCHDVAGALFTDTPRILILEVKWEKDTVWIRGMLEEVLEEYNVKLVPSHEPMRFMCAGKVLQFISSARLSHSTLGMQDYCLISFVDY
jgi:hypothetical protein